MPKFSIAFISSAEQKPLRHRIIEAEDRESALKTFFSEEVNEFYSSDDQGYYYFKDDFTDKSAGLGSVIQID